MALAKPVMGTRVPAPARLAMSSNTPRPVSRAARKISVMDTQAPASSRVMPRYWYRLDSPWPPAQMPPPTQKAHARSFHRGEGWAMALTYCLYS